MAFLDFEKFTTIPLQHDPCPFLVVPGFVKPEALDKINSDYPTIEKPGNFPLDGLEFGPAFQQFVSEMQGPEMRRFFSEKFGMDLAPYPTSNERSYHGFHPCTGERRTVQMYWVEPKRAARGEKKKRGPVAKFMKRLRRKRR
jgi:hypothetical protein